MDYLTLQKTTNELLRLLMPYKVLKCYICHFNDECFCFICRDKITFLGLYHAYFGISCSKNNFKEYLFTKPLPDELTFFNFSPSRVVFRLKFDNLGHSRVVNIPFVVSPLYSVVRYFADGCASIEYELL